MPPRPFVAPRGRVALSAAVVLIAAACSADQPPPTATTAATGVADATATPLPTATPSPTLDPTPRFTNPPDAALAAVLPATVAGLPLVVAPVDTFALTPGDVGLAFGELGLRFDSLAVAYVEQPRLTLYAVRVDGRTVTNEDLAPHLATAGRYLGIAGLVPEPWELATVGGHEVWTRAGDRATAAGTALYVWAADDLVFLLIGVDDAVNQALVAALPGVPPPTPSPVPTAPSRTPVVSPSPGG
jgi:hypothetical protein